MESYTYIHNNSSYLCLNGASLLSHEFKQYQHEIEIKIGNQTINNTTYHPILIYNQFNNLTNNQQQSNQATILILPINNSCIHVCMHIYLPIYIYIHTYTYTLKSIHFKIPDSNDNYFAMQSRNLLAISIIALMCSLSSYQTQL